MSYAHLCLVCAHLGSRHLKPIGGDKFRCRDCGCESGDMRAMTKSEYDRRRDAGMPTWEQEQRRD